MNCAAYLPNGNRCPAPCVDGDVCNKHAMWKQAAAPHRLGFNLIVKNEEAVLETCMRSIREIADEIVVTDTGSEDKTVEIALKWADKVLFHKWQDSFSEARNWSLQFSTADLICWIDADESVIPESRDALQRLKFDDGGFSAYFTPLISELPGGRGSKHYLPKIFRRGTAYFESIVHNQLIHQTPVVTRDDTRFFHTGYNLSNEIMERKRNRTIALLRKQLETEPNDPFAMMNLGRTLLTSGKHTESLEIAEKALKVEGVPANTQQMLYYNVAACHIHLKDLDKAKEAVWQCLTINAENVDMLFFLGWIACLEGKWNEATVYLNRYRQAREEQEQNGFNLLILDFWDARPQLLEFLCIAYQNMKQYERALEFAYEGVEVMRYDPHAWERLLTLLNLAGRRNDFEKCLRQTTNMGLGNYKVVMELANL